MTLDTVTRQHADKSLAILAEGLYLLNLLFPLIPLGFLFLIRHRRLADAGSLGRNHLGQALVGAIISSAFFLLANVIIVSNGGYRSVAALISFEVYFIAIVPLFVIPGLLALLRAMNGQEYRYPLIGRLAR